MNKIARPSPSSTSHKLWLEILHQQATPNTPKSIQSSRENLKSHHSINYKTQEEYYDEVIALKKNVTTLKGENDYFKSKLRQLEEELEKKNKEMTDFINTIEGQQKSKDSTLNTHVTIMKLKQNVAQLKSMLKIKENEILELKSDLKFTKLNESKIQTEIYQQEIKSLQQLLKNAQQISSKSHDSITRSKSGSPIKSSVTKKSSSINDVSPKSNKYKLLLRENKELSEENKSLKLENQKLIREMFDMLEKESGKPEKSKDIEKAAVDKLKNTCVELNKEKNIITEKYEELSMKYKQMKEKQTTSPREMKEPTKQKESEIEPRKPRSTSLKPTPQKLGSDKLSESDYIIQSGIYSYLLRSNAMQLEKEQSIDDDELISAIEGFMTRQKLLNPDVVPKEFDDDSLVQKPVHSSVLGYLARDEILNPTKLYY